jgi:mannose-6-phosphate isomerase class I
MFQVKTGAADIKHLIVTNGRAMIKSKKQNLPLKKGETTILSEKDSVNIENPGKKFLSIIQVEMVNG